MKSVLFAAALACGFVAAGARGAQALPATVVMRTEGPSTAVTPVDYYWHHHHWHHRRWEHDHWHYWD